MTVPHYQCDPIRCWGGRSSRFLELLKLARDILSMPGMSLLEHTFHLLTWSAVAVECIFSRGRDTISLRRANLKPETILILMLAKRLRLARTCTILRVPKNLLSLQNWFWHFIRLSTGPPVPSDAYGYGLMTGRVRTVQIYGRHRIRYVLT